MIFLSNVNPFNLCFPLQQYDVWLKWLPAFTWSCLYKSTKWRHFIPQHLSTPLIELSSHTELFPVPQIFGSEPREEEMEVCLLDIAYDEIPERHYKESEVRRATPLTSGCGVNEYLQPRHRYCGRKWKEGWIGGRRREVNNWDVRRREQNRVLSFLHQHQLVLDHQLAICLLWAMEGRETHVYVWGRWWALALEIWHLYARAFAHLSGRDGHKKLSY